MSARRFRSLHHRFLALHSHRTRFRLLEPNHCVYRVVTCHGRIVLGEEAAGLRDTLKKVLTTSRQVVLNLAGVDYIDSSGLGTLVGVYSSARAAGADIKLTGVGQRLRDVLQITKLVTVFEVYDTEQEALASFDRVRK
jgi:anti-sigma B factor antagonist